MNSSDFQPGVWYLVVDCRYCGARHALFEDLTRGASRVKATYCWTCPDCKQKADYGSDDVKSYQEPLKKKRAV